MTALVFALACLMSTPDEPEIKRVTEEESLSILLAKKARWNEGTKTLEITGAGKFARQDLRTLRNITSVQTLHIAYTLGDDDLAPLRECGQLQTVVLTGNHFTDNAILHLAAMPSLQTLKLEDCRLTAVGIAALSNMKTLNSLSLIQVSLPKQAVAELKSVPSLRVLTMRKASFVKGLSGCRQLRVLRLKGLDETILNTDEIVTELGDLKQLESLTLSVMEKTVLPSSARKWFDLDFESGAFVATRHYPLCDRLKTALPNTEVSIKFENQSLTFQEQNGSETLRFY